MKFLALFVICLSFAAVYCGISNMKLKIANCWTCGGRRVRLRLWFNRVPCDTVEFQDFDGDALLEWTGSNLGSCRQFNIDQTVTLKVQSPSTTEFYPEWASISTTNGALYNASLSGAYSRRTNRIPHTMTNPVPAPICPRVTDNACPVQNMVAYATNGYIRKQCVFSCPFVNSADPQNRNIRESGMTCYPVSFQVPNLSYCCRSRRTSGGMPKCTEAQLAQSAMLINSGSGNAAVSGGNSYSGSGSGGYVDSGSGSSNSGTRGSMNGGSSYSGSGGYIDSGSGSSNYGSGGGTNSGSGGGINSGSGGGINSVSGGYSYSSSGGSSNLNGNSGGSNGYSNSYGAEESNGDFI